MALTLTLQPEEISFSRNPIWFTFKTDNLYSSQGQSSSFMWYIHPQLSFENNTFTLKYGQISQDFVFKRIPDDSGLQLHAFFQTTPAEWIKSIADDFENNFLISRDYIITIDNSLGEADPRILFTARVNDAIYDLTIVSTSVSLLLVRSGSKRLKQPNFKIFLEIWVANNSKTSFDNILSNQFLDVDDDGFASINLSSHLTKALIGVHNDFDRPDHVSPVVQVNYKSCRQYFIRYGEAYGAAQAIRKVSKTSLRWVLLGGVGKSFIKNYSIPVNFYVGGKHRFLKQENLIKSIRLIQPEWLSMVWLTDPGNSSVALRVKTYFSDNNFDEKDLFPLGAINKYDKITYPVGPTQLNLPGLYPDKIIIQYEVCVISLASRNPVTEVRTYLLDYRFQVADRFSVALSSLGSYDTFYSHGLGSSEFDLTSISAEVSRSVDFHFEEGETFTFDNSLDQKETVLTGFIPKRELKRFRDLFLSWDKFIIHGQTLIPVSVSSKNIKEYKDDDRLFALTYEIAYRFSEQLWTEDLSDALPSVPADLSAFWPAISNPDPINYDNLYYRKTQTYNKAEVDAVIAKQLEKEQADHQAQQRIIDALLVSVNLKADKDHLHDDRYVKISDFNDTVTGLVQGLVGQSIQFTHDPTQQVFKIENWQTAKPAGYDLTYVELAGNSPIFLIQEKSENNLIDRPQIPAIRICDISNPADLILLEVQFDIGIGVDFTGYLNIKR